jgi:hypothetical protein
VYVLENNNVLRADIDYQGESARPAGRPDICGFLKPNAYYRKNVMNRS